AAFATAAEALRGVADDLEGPGVPPGYQVLQALGECHRRFLRLRHEVGRRASAAGLAVPPPEQVRGLGDLARLGDALAAGARGVPAPVPPTEPALPPAPEPEPEAPAPAPPTVAVAEAPPPEPVAPPAAVEVAPETEPETEPEPEPVAVRPLTAVVAPVGPE